MTRQITLTRGKFAMVDDDDYHRLVPFKWYAMRTKQNGEKWYAKRVVRKPGSRASSNIYMHREILAAGHGEEVDHRDRDGLNNIRSNLRICTRWLNGANSVGNKLASSGYRGVYAHGKKYRSVVSVNGRKFRLGTYDSAIEAAKARDKFAAEACGEFALLNFPPD